MKITEKQFSLQVENLLDIFHWRWTHFRPARTEHGWRTALSGHAGFLDYIAAKNERLLIFELKSEKGKLSPAQKEWIEALEKTKAEVYIFKPENFDEIAEILR